MKKIFLLAFLSLSLNAVSYNHLLTHNTPMNLVCRLLLEKKKRTKKTNANDTIHKINLYRQR
ncbi:hypothetical protein, partial [Campylobacter coli]|uniref:hypothetical protein n=1 Tax=Campylobacter coli TaxID=195 RepID=UPI0038263014